jgi:hypothetical protein
MAYVLSLTRCHHTIEVTFRALDVSAFDTGPDRILQPVPVVLRCIHEEGHAGDHISEAPGLPQPVTWAMRLNVCKSEQTKRGG